MLKVYILKKVWSPIVWKFGARRADNFDFSDYCGLDFDDSLTVDDAIGIFKDYRAVIATTENHRRRKNEVIADRFRVIVPWERRITCVNEYQQNMAAVIKEYGADAACKDAGRLFKPSKEIVFANDNELFPVVPYVPAPPRPVVIYTGRPAWLTDLIARGSDGEAGRNIAGFKIAVACFRCSLKEREVEEILSQAYGVNTLSEKERRQVVRSASKAFQAEIKRASNLAGQ